MKIDRRKVGNKQVRTYQTKVSKKELEYVLTDILESYKINRTISIEVKE